MRHITAEKRDGESHGIQQNFARPMVFEGLFATPSPLLPGGQVKFLGNVFEGIQTADTEVL